MRLPSVRGTIARRILMNFRADPDAIQSVLPAPFRPKLFEGETVVGVCLIRLEAIRPQFFAPKIGVSSENAAHRFAVVWEENGTTREGVYIARRDTGSVLNSVLGGRIFPGEHHSARFGVEQNSEKIDLQMRSRDRQIEVRARGKIGATWPQGSLFPDLEAASRFFKPGSMGFSERFRGPGLDGLELRTHDWRVEFLDLETAFSSYFADENRFGKGAIVFDHALLMRGIEHEWHGVAAPN